MKLSAGLVVMPAGSFYIIVQGMQKVGLQIGQRQNKKKLYITKNRVRGSVAWRYSSTSGQHGMKLMPDKLLTFQFR